MSTYSPPNGPSHQGQEVRRIAAFATCLAAVIACLSNGTTILKYFNVELRPIQDRTTPLPVPVSHKDIAELSEPAAPTRSSAGEDPKPKNLESDSAALPSAMRKDDDNQAVSKPIDVSTAASVWIAHYKFGDQTLTGYYDHGKMDLVYDITNPGMTALGAAGALYGKLSFSSGSISGWVQRRTKKCGLIKFDIIGSVSANFDSINFEGQAPTVDSDTCKVVQIDPAHVVLSKL